MNDTIEPKEFETFKECFKQPFFYLLLAILLVWSVYASSKSLHFVIPFATGLTILTCIDMKHMILPDIVTFPMTILALALHLLLSGYIIIPALGAIVGFILFFLVFYISYKIKGTPGMGFGDVKLLTMLGAWVGVSGLPLVLIYASVSALLFVLLKTIYKKGFSNKPFPYGPFLCLGGWLTFLYHDASWTVILNIREIIIKTILG